MSMQRRCRRSLVSQMTKQDENPGVKTGSPSKLGERTMNKQQLPKGDSTPKKQKIADQNCSPLRRTPSRRAKENKHVNATTTPKKGEKRKEMADGRKECPASKFTCRDEDETHEVPSKSFYGSSAKGYRNPLQRKADARKSLEVENEQQMISLSDAADKIVKVQTGNRKYINRKNIGNVKPKRRDTPMPLKEKPNTQDRFKNFDSKTVKHESPQKKAASTSGRKFFKHHTPSKRKFKRQIGKTVVTSKGFEIKFKPDSSTRNSARKNNAKALLVGKTRSLKEKSGGIISGKASLSANEIPRNESENPLSQDLFSEDSEWEKKDSGNFSEMGSTDTSTDTSSLLKSKSSFPSSPDSVALISEYDSEKSQSPGIGSQGLKKKMFPIFSAKASPTTRCVLRSESCPNTPVNASQSSQLSSSATKNSPKILKKLIEKDGKEQMLLDLGQKRIGAVQCQSCGMTYSIGEPSDEATHLKFHQRLNHILKFPGWKKERIVQEEIDGSRIVMILPEDRFATKKVAQIRQIVDQDLGFVTSTVPLSNAKTFLCISEDRQVVGCCIAQSILKGYRVLGENEALTAESMSQRQKPWCCSTEPEKAKCGINRIWVSKAERLRGVATKLVDAVRFNFIMGCPLQKSDLAFTDPTPDGRNFFTKYMGTSNFLVYKTT